MKILVINCGSSSLKFQVIDAETEELLAKGLCERIGIDGSITYENVKDGKDKMTTTPAIPKEYYDKYKIRRYGFHGTSHDYVSAEGAKFIGKNREDLKIIVAHLGNGASISAVKFGKCIDTSMGLTPLEGLAMGTRSGDIDPAIVEFIANKEDITVHKVLEILQKKSGVLGLSDELSSDFRDLGKAKEEGNEAAAVALDTFAYRVAKYIGSYAAAMDGVDLICFTAGVGENDQDCRAQICSYLDYLGCDFDPVANKVRGKIAMISREDSKVKALVVPTNEELAIARQTFELVK